MKNKQKGFSVAAVLIVMVIIGVVSTAGWIVYDRQKSKTDSKDMSGSANTQANEQTKQEAKDEIKQPTYFEIKELGVKFKLNDRLAGLYYSMGNNNKTAYFSLNELKDTDCAADKTAQIALTRYTDADFNSDLAAHKDSARKIGDYYFMSVGGQAACSEDDRIQQRATQLRADIAQLLPGALITL